MELEINYKPRSYQKILHESTARWKVLVWHRWSWKTTASLAELVKRSLLKKGVYEFISPTYKQSKRNARPILKDLVKWRPRTQANESELKLTLPNWSVIYMLGSDDPDSLRGLDFHGVVFDEYSQQPGNVFSEIVRPRLSITNWRVIWIGTPKGYNQFYDLYMKATAIDAWDLWLGVLQTVNDTKVISEKELSDARKDMDHAEFEQEMLCSFNAAIKWAYYAKELTLARTDGRVKLWLYDPMKLVYTARDLGISDSTYILFAQLDGENLNIIDYYENNSQSLQHYVKVLDDRWYRYWVHYFPHDSAQRARQTGISDIDHMRGFLGSDRCVMLGITRFDNGIKKARLIFHRICFDETKCKEFINALTQYTQERDDKKAMFRDKPKHDRTSHAADSFRYLCSAYEDIRDRSKTNKHKPARIIEKLNPRTMRPIKENYKSKFKY